MRCAVRNTSPSPERRDPAVPTMDDVARHAGVSQSTVSRVLAGARGVSAEKADRVRTACAALNFQPNTAASILAGGRPKALGLWTSDIRNRFFMEIVSGVLQTAQAHKYIVMLASYIEELRERQLRHYADMLGVVPLAGAIVVGAFDRDPGLQIFSQRGIPLVSIDHAPFDDVSDLVNIDNVGAARDAVSHLIENGYRRIGIVVGPKSSMTGRDRLAGYRMALEAANLPRDPALELVGQYGEELGYAGTCRLLDLPEPIDALLSTSEGTNLGALRALADRGVRVPEDLAVVGFDERDGPGVPQLTTVVQPAMAMGSTAARLLIHRLENPGPHVRQQVILQHELRIGGTSQPKHARGTNPDPRDQRDGKDGSHDASTYSS
jgi:LacI family transcriptional regulator